MAKIEDIRPRKGRYNTYCILYTTSGNLCASVGLAEKLCLFEPYELSGQVNMSHGGTFLWCQKAELFEGRKYRQGVL